MGWDRDGVDSVSLLSSSRLTDESPRGSNHVDKDANTGTVFDMTVNRIRRRYGRDNLISHGRNGDSDNGRNVVLMCRELLKSHAKDDETYHGKHETKV